MIRLKLESNRASQFRRVHLFIIFLIFSIGKSFSGQLNEKISYLQMVVENNQNILPSNIYIFQDKVPIKSQVFPDQNSYGNLVALMALENFTVTSSRRLKKSLLKGMKPFFSGGLYYLWPEKEKGWRGPSHFPFLGQFKRIFKNFPPDLDISSLAISSRGPLDIDRRKFERVTFYSLGKEGFYTWPKKGILSNGEGGPHFLGKEREKVDCIVNLNIIGALSLNSDNSREEKYQQVCKTLVKSAQNEALLKTCNHHFPNDFAFPYFYAKAYTRGAHCLREGIGSLKSYLKKERNREGFWSSSRWGHLEDRMISTSLAVSTLVSLGEFSSKYFKNTHKILRSSLNQQQVTEGAINLSSLPQGKKMIWKSGPLTSILALEALFSLKKIGVNEL